MSITLSHSQLRAKAFNKIDEYVMRNAEVLWAEDCLDDWANLNYQEVKSIAQKEGYWLLIWRNLIRMRHMDSAPLYKTLNSPSKDPLYKKITDILKCLPIIVWKNHKDWIDKYSMHTEQSITEQCEEYLNWWLTVLEKRTRWPDPKDGVHTGFEHQERSRNEINEDTYNAMIDLKTQDYKNFLYNICFLRLWTEYTLLDIINLSKE